MSDRPAPLLAPEVSMRGLKYMPLQTEILKGSKAWLACRRRPELGFYLINLWMSAWAEEPCASIENDADVLAASAGCPPDKWESLADVLLRGWVLCSDNRFYHPFLAEVATESWGKRVKNEKDRALDRARKRDRRAKQKQSLIEMSARTSGGQMADDPKCPADVRTKTRRREKVEDRKVEDSLASLESPPTPIRQPEIFANGNGAALPEERDVAQDAFLAFQALAEELKLPCPTKLNDRRRRAIAARLREHGPDAVQLALNKIRGSPFLRGEKGRDGWCAKIDWVFGPENFLKIIEGNYDERPDRNGSAANGAGVVAGDRGARASRGPVDVFTLAARALGET